MKNYYTVLGVPQNATDDMIKSAYRMLAKRWHPDKNPGNKMAEEKFREIAEAYSVLSDPILRSQHDKKLQHKYYFSGEYSFAPPEKPKHRDPARAESPEYSDAYKRWYFARSQKNIKRRKQIFTGMIITFVCWLVFAYGISNYHPETYNRVVDSIAEAKKDSAAAALAKLSKKPIENMDSPYDSVFGQGVYDYISFNVLEVKAGTYPAVYCLQQAEAPFAIIRNDYVEANTDFSWKQIPYGKYYLRFYTGTDWSVSKEMNGGKVKGGFMKDNAFVKYEKELHFTKPTSADPQGNNEERITMPAKINGDFKTITEAEFFSTK